jgi:hypothetical protein
MKILRTEVLLNSGTSGNINQLLNEIQDAILKVTWPESNNLFSMNPVRKGNGVKPIKNACMSHLKSVGWLLEQRLPVIPGIRPGPIDAVKQCGASKFALEWETGNISSSHRAINKMVLGMLERSLVGGVLVLPSRDMYNYLTDRVGNFQELSPYFPMWRRFNIKDGYLAIIEVEHDVLSPSAPLIPKGTDGRAVK